MVCYSSCFRLHRFILDVHCFDSMCGLRVSNDERGYYPHHSNLLCYLPQKEVIRSSLDCFNRYHCWSRISRLGKLSLLKRWPRYCWIDHSPRNLTSTSILDFRSIPIRHRGETFRRLLPWSIVCRWLWGILWSSLFLHLITHFPANSLRQGWSLWWWWFDWGFNSCF